MGKIVNQDLPADPPAPSAGSHVIYSKAAGVFVRTPTGVVGPLSAGGTVNDLQDAYDGGNAIATTVANGAVSISSTLPGGPDALSVAVGVASSSVGIVVQQDGTGNGIYVDSSSTANASIRSVASGAGSAEAIKAEVTDPASTGAGLRVIHNGPGTPLDVEVSSPATNVAGAHIEFTNPSNTGPGILVENDLASTSKFVGIQVQATTGTGGAAIIARNLGSGSSIYAQKTGTGSEPVVEIASSNAAATGAGVEINVNSSLGAPGQVIRIDPAATANAIEVRNPAAVFSVDSAGNTTTPSVVFGGGSTVTVRGDTGVAGTPINPRVELTSGSTSVGRVARVHSGSVKTGAVSVDVELTAGGQFSDFRNEQPTFVAWQNSGAPGQVVYLPSAERYPVGTELILWCVPSGSSIVVTDFGAGNQQIKDTTGASATQNMIAGSARRFLSISAGGWILSGSF